MSGRDHQPIHIREYNGLFSRGSADVVPPDHFIDCLNLRFDQLGVKNRGGASLNVSLNSIKRVQLYTRISEAQRRLILDTTGNIYDATASLTIPILQGAVWATGGFADFSAVSLFNRAYLTPHNRVNGATGGIVWVYDSSSTWGTIATVVINSGGAGYTVNDVLTLTGGISGMAATLTVLTEAAGVITSVAITTRGNGYQVKAANAVTGGTGAGATFTTTILAAARPAAGVKPTSGVTAATSGTAGNVEAGLHLIRVVYETDSGFITQGNATPTQYTAPGAFKIDLTNIPLGPAGTAKRHILATKIITNYSGRPDDYEFFFVPSGEIADNTTTTLTINFFDNDLVASGDYLLDQAETIAAMVYVNSYQGSMIGGGEDNLESVVRVSKPGEPESFSSIDGFLLANPGDAGEGVKNGIEYRDLYFIHKGQRTYITKNNGAEPATWDVNLVDNAIGTECYGASIVVDSLGNTLDRFIIADRAGLALYDGSFKDKQLSWKIEDTWNRINKQYFNQIKVCIDPVRKLIHVNVPLDSATEPSHVLTFDYKNGLDPANIRCGIDLYQKKPTSIFITNNRAANDLTPQLEFGSSEHNVYIQKDSNASDDGSAINSYGETAKLYLSDDGVVNHYGKVQLRVKGSGNLSLTLNGLDDVITSSLGNIALAVSPGKEYFKLANLQSEKCSVKFQQNTTANNFLINKISLFIAPLWEERAS